MSLSPQPETRFVVEATYFRPSVRNETDSHYQRSPFIVEMIFSHLNDQPTTDFPSSIIELTFSRFHQRIELQILLSVIVEVIFSQFEDERLTNSIFADGHVDPLLINNQPSSNSHPLRSSNRSCMSPLPDGQ